MPLSFSQESRHSGNPFVNPWCQRSHLLQRTCDTCTSSPMETAARNSPLRIWRWKNFGIRLASRDDSMEVCIFSRSPNLPRSQACARRVNCLIATMFRQAPVNCLTLPTPGLVETRHKLGVGSNRTAGNKPVAFSKGDCQSLPIP